MLIQWHNYTVPSKHIIIYLRRHLSNMFCKQDCVGMSSLIGKTLTMPVEPRLDKNLLFSREQHNV